MKKEFTPEELAYLQTVYKDNAGHVRWMLRSLIIGAAIGIGMAALTGGITPRNPGLWVGLIYGAAFPVLDYKSPRVSIKQVIIAPVTYAKELNRRFKEIGAGRRALKQRFADHY